MGPSLADQAARTSLPGSVTTIRVLLWVQVALVGLAIAAVALLVLFLGMIGISATRSSGDSLWQLALLMLLLAIAVLAIPVAVAIIAKRPRSWARRVIVAWETLMVLVSVGLGALVVVGARAAASGWSIATTNGVPTPPPIDPASFVGPLVWLGISGAVLLLAVGRSTGDYYRGNHK